jgi:predicted NodU family carbamoyl transferase
VTGPYRELPDGLHLFTYLNPSGLYRYAGVWFRHDNNLSLWRKTGRHVELLRYWELERFTRQKQHRTPFASAADAGAFLGGLLEPLGVELDDLAGIYGTPGLGVGERDLPPLAVPPSIATHSVCHLYSAMAVDTRTVRDRTILAFAVDGVPDTLLDRGYREHWFAGGVVRDGAVTVFPVRSPGPLWMAAKDRFGLREGTLMALASATGAVGDSTARERVHRLGLTGLDSIRESAEFLTSVVDEVRATLRPDVRFDVDESLTSAVMKEVQSASEDVMRANVTAAVELYGLDPADSSLAVAGGFALNCPTNTVLMDEFGFRELLTTPAPSDCGQSLGLAMLAFGADRPADRIDITDPGAYLGAPVTDLAATVRAGASRIRRTSRRVPLSDVVADIVTDPVGWVAGRAELGPRALGNRSILGDPRRAATRDRLNEAKGRAWWRPVAPVLPAESVADWFVQDRSSPHMLEAFRIRPEKARLVPAIVHLDGSARVQTVHRPENPLLWELLKEFERATGVPILCNTSLNGRGEPIVQTAAQAVRFCSAAGLRVLYCDQARVELEPQPDAGDPPPLAPAFGDADAAGWGIRLETWNPHRLSDECLFVYLHTHSLVARFDIVREEDARSVRSTVEGLFDQRPGLRESVRAQVVEARADLANTWGRS